MLALVLLLVLPGLGAEICLVQKARQRAARAGAALEAKNQERDRLGRLSPAPSESNVQAIAGELAEAEKNLKALVAGWREAETSAAQLPAGPETSLEAYFDIAAFVERTRAQAGRNEVRIRPAEQFGFSSHASGGPEVELVPVVFRQRVAVQHLLDALIAARPHALLAVQREHPLTVGQRGPRPGPKQALAARAASAVGSGAASDFFDITGQGSLRRPAQVDGEAYRLEFSGQTQALRDFLNTLAKSSRPFVVRRVEAEPMVAGMPETNPVPNSVNAGAPLVPRTISKFVVVVEHIVPVAEESAP